MTKKKYTRGKPVKFTVGIADNYDRFKEDYKDNRPTIFTRLNGDIVSCIMEFLFGTRDVVVLEQLQSYKLEYQRMFPICHNDRLFNDWLLMNSIVSSMRFTKKQNIESFNERQTRIEEFNKHRCDVCAMYSENDLVTVRSLNKKKVLTISINTPYFCGRCGRCDHSMENCPMNWSCSNCGSIDHITKFCVKSKSEACEICGSLDHFTHFCTEKKKKTLFGSTKDFCRVCSDRCLYYVDMSFCSDDDDEDDWTPWI
jgi:hypothetical protein